MYVSGNYDNGVTNVAFKVEVVDLSGEGQTCAAIADFPSTYGALGAYFDGFPTACLGTTCKKYNLAVSH